MKKLNFNTPFVQKFGLPIGLVAILVILQLFNLDTPLLSWQNISNIFMQNTAIALVALGVSFIMISGEGDMSFSGMFSLLTAVFAVVANKTDNYFAALFTVLAIAAAVNLVIVFLVNKFGFSSFISSIAFMFMAQGVERAIHQQTTHITNPDFKEFINIEFGFSLIVWIMLLVFVIGYFVINKTKFGFNLRVTGENVHAGIEAGINVKRMKIYAYIGAAICLTLATSFETARTGAIYNQGASVMLPVFAACYLGSSMFVPGRVNVAGTLFGAMFVSMIDGFMKMMSVEFYMVPIVQGIILVASVALSLWTKRKTITQVPV